MVVNRNIQDMEARATRSVRRMMYGHEPDMRDVEALAGELRVCVAMLHEELKSRGRRGVQKLFVALVLEGRVWLIYLAVGDPIGEELAALCEPTQEESSAQSERPIRFLPDSAFENRPAREWLIPPILPKEGIALVFGPSGCGKSFLTMAWSLCIATGTPWLGREVLRGPVAYIAAEGSYGIGPRVSAWKKFQEFSGESGVQWFDQAVILPDASNLSALRTALHEDFLSLPVLVVIDTLSRCSAGFDENSNTEMARLISAADRIQQEYHCAVLIVHHTGKEDTRGPRGASALIGNTETIIEVASTGAGQGCSLTCFKQKDAPPFAPLALKFQSVRYGADAEENSVVLIHDADPEVIPGLRQSEQTMLAALSRAEQPLTYSEWRKVGVEAGLKERTAEAAIQNLVRDGYVQKSEKRYSVVMDRSGQAQVEENEEPPAPSYPYPEPPEPGDEPEIDIDCYYDPEPDYSTYEGPEDDGLPPDYPAYGDEPDEEPHFLS